MGSKIYFRVNTVAGALITAGVTAFVFAGCFIFFLFFCIAGVQGGGGKQPITVHIAESIITFTGKLFGFPDYSANVFVVVFLWSLIVFVIVFAAILFLGIAEGRIGKTPGSRPAKYTALMMVVVICLLMILLYKDRQDKRAEAEERKLAVAFVEQNERAMQRAGGSGIVSLNTWSKAKTKGKATRYDITVLGPKTIHAIVESERTGGKPSFTVICTTDTNPVTIDTHKKDICEQPGSDLLEQ